MPLALAPLNDTRHWRVTDHACRICLGRILERTSEQGWQEVRCAECGGQVSPGSPRSLCFCGANLETGADAGLHCVGNPGPTTAVPDQVLVEYREPKHQPRVRGVGSKSRTARLPFDEQS